MALAEFRRQERRESHQVRYLRRAEGCERQRDQENPSSGFSLLRQTNRASQREGMSKVKLVMYLDYGCQKREMTVAYAPGGQTCYSDRSRTIEPKPMIRIANRMLLESGFKVGSRVSIEYGHDIITVRKLHNHEHNINIQTPSPLTNPTRATSAVAA